MIDKCNKLASDSSFIEVTYHYGKKPKEDTSWNYYDFFVVKVGDSVYVFKDSTYKDTLEIRLDTLIYFAH